MQHPPGVDDSAEPEPPSGPLDPPDMDDVAEDELFCFFNQQRPCTAECMAYKTFPEDNRHLDRHQTHCVLISSAERGSRSLNIIASLINKAVGQQKDEKADAQRAGAFGSQPVAQGNSIKVKP